MTKELEEGKELPMVVTALLVTLIAALFFVYGVPTIQQSEAGGPESNTVNDSVITTLPPMSLTP